MKKLAITTLLLTLSTSVFAYGTDGLLPFSQSGEQAVITPTANQTYQVTSVGTSGTLPFSQTGEISQIQRLNNHHK